MEELCDKKKLAFFHYCNTSKNHTAKSCPTYKELGKYDQFLKEKGQIDGNSKMFPMS